MATQKRQRTQRGWRRLFWLSTIGFALTLVLAFAPDPTVSGQIDYQLAWEWGAATADPDGGWAVATDLGYSVHVETAYVTSYATQVIACEHSHEAGFLDKFWSWLSPMIAEAGHGAEENEAEYRVPLVEDLAQPLDTPFGSVTVSEPSYCYGHYLLAQTPDSAFVAVPDDLEMRDSTLRVVGTYQTPAMAAPQAFSAETALANAVYEELRLAGQSAAIHADIGNQTLTVTIQRQLATLFDTADFATMDSAELGRAILWQLVADTEIVVTGGATH